jgi:hypothetical protein
VDTEAILAVFRIIAPEFAAVTPTDLISLAIGWISPDAFGSRSSEAVAYLVAHVLTLQDRVTAEGGAGSGGAGVGSITSKKAGDLAIGYGGTAAASKIIKQFEDVYLLQTTHGLAYLSLRDSRAEVGFGLLQ